MPNKVHLSLVHRSDLQKQQK